MARLCYLRTVDVTRWVSAWPSQVSAAADSAVPDAQFTLRAVALDGTDDLLVDSLPDGPLPQDDLWFVDDAGRPLPLDPLVEFFSGRVKTVADSDDDEGNLQWALSAAGYHEDLNQIVDWVTFDTADLVYGGRTYHLNRDVDRVRYLMAYFLPSWQFGDDFIPPTQFATYDAPTSYRQVPLVDILRDIATYTGLPSDAVYPAPARAWRLGSTAAGGLGKYLQYYSRVNGATTSSVGVCTEYADPPDANEVLGTNPKRTEDTSALINAVAVRGPGGDVTAVQWNRDSLVNVSAQGNTLTKTDGVDGDWDAGAFSEQSITDEGGYIEARPVPPDGTEAALVWSATGRVNVAVSSAALTKNGGTDGTFDAGAFGDSSQGMDDLGGYVQTELPLTARVLAFGLSHSNPDATNTSIAFGIQTTGTGAFAVIASGAVIGAGASYGAGDSVRVRVGPSDTGTPIPVGVELLIADTTDWVPVWSGTLAAGTLTFPLYADVSLATIGEEWDAGARTSTTVSAPESYCLATLKAGKRSAFGWAPSTGTLANDLTDVRWGIYTAPGDVCIVTNGGGEIARFTYLDDMKVRLTTKRIGAADALEVATQPSGSGTWTVRTVWTLTAGPFLYPLAMVGVFGSTAGVSIHGRIKAAGGSEADVTWDAGTATRVSISTHTISKSGTNAPSISGGQILITPPQVVEAAWGFSAVDSDAGHASITEGFQTLADGTLNIIEAGHVLADFTYERGDWFRLDLRPDNTGTLQAEATRYYADGSGGVSLFVWTPGGLTFPLYVDTSIATFDAQLADVTLRRHSYSKHQRDDSVGPPWNFGLVWANQVFEDESLDTIPKRAAFADRLFDAHAYPRIGYSIETDGRRPDGSRWQFDPGMLVPFRDPARTWDPAVNLPLGQVTTDWSQAQDEAWPVQHLEAGDRFPEAGEAAPYLLRTPGLDTPIPATPTGLIRLSWGPEGAGTAFVTLGWDRTTHTERRIILRLWRRLGSSGREIFVGDTPFDAGLVSGTLHGLVPARYRVEIAAEDSRGRVSPFGHGIPVEVPPLIPPAPTSVTLIRTYQRTLTTGGAVVAWTLGTDPDPVPEGVSGFDVLVATGGELPYLAPVTVPPDARQAALEPLSIGPAYLVYVRTRSAWGTTSAAVPVAGLPVRILAFQPQPVPPGRGGGPDGGPSLGWTQNFGTGDWTVSTALDGDVTVRASYVLLCDNAQAVGIVTDPGVDVTPGQYVTLKLAWWTNIGTEDVLAYARIRAYDRTGTEVDLDTPVSAEDGLTTVQRLEYAYLVPSDAVYLTLQLVGTGATGAIELNWAIEEFEQTKTNANLTDSAVDSRVLAADSVTSTKIADDAVTVPKLDLRTDNTVHVEILDAGGTAQAEIYDHAGSSPHEVVWSQDTASGSAVQWRLITQDGSEIIIGDTSQINRLWVAQQGVSTPTVLLNTHLVGADTSNLTTTAGDVTLRSDLFRTGHGDGSRVLSEPFPLPMGPYTGAVAPYSVTTEALFYGLPGDLALYLLYWRVTRMVNGTHDNSNKWTIKLRMLDSGGASTTDVASVSSWDHTGGGWQKLPAVTSFTQPGTSNGWLEVQVIKVGSPGTLELTHYLRAAEVL